MVLSDSWAIPFTIALLVQFVLVLATAFLPPKTSGRPATLIAVTALLLLLNGIARGFLKDQFLNSSIIMHMFLLLTKSFDVLYLRDVTYESDTKTCAKAKRNNNKSKAAGMLSRFLWATASLWNFREVQTPWQIKNIAPFSTRNPSYVPSRKVFLLRQTALLVFCYVVLDLFASRPSPDLKDFSIPRQAFFLQLSEITIEGLMTRLASTLAMFFNIFCFNTYLYSLVAIICVGLGISDPLNWPPMYDSILKAYSVRHFWGNTWHQTFRRPLEANSDFIAHSVLSLPRGLIARYTRLFLAFGLSGLLHRVAELVIDVPAGETGAMKFFLMQPLAIMVEDAVQESCRRIDGGKARLWKSIVGYVWCIAFLTWTTPSWSYPMIRLVKDGGNNNSILPFTIFGRPENSTL